MSAIKTDEVKNSSNVVNDKATAQADNSNDADVASAANFAKSEEATEKVLSEGNNSNDAASDVTKANTCCSGEAEACGCENTSEAKECGCYGEKDSLEAENRRLADEMLRMRAEMENSKKRLHRLFEEKAQEKSKQLLLDIITLLDNFERAMTAGEHSKQDKGRSSADSVVEGIRMMEEEFLQTLSSKWGLTRYNSVNLEFDPALHEAMMKEYSDEVSCETVTEEFMKGYMFYEKVLRPAKVKITVPKTKE